MSYLVNILKYTTSIYKMLLCFLHHKLISLNNPKLLKRKAIGLYYAGTFRLTWFYVFYVNLKRYRSEIKWFMTWSTNEIALLIEAQIHVSTYPMKGYIFWIFCGIIFVLLVALTTGLAIYLRRLRPIPKVTRSDTTSQFRLIFNSVNVNSSFEVNICYFVVSAVLRVGDSTNVNSNLK